MRIDPEMIETIRGRMQGIRDWIADDAPYICADQRHLDEHTPERAYWHHGYQAALADVLALVRDPSVQNPAMRTRPVRVMRSGRMNLVIWRCKVVIQPAFFLESGLC